MIGEGKIEYIASRLNGRLYFFNNEGEIAKTDLFLVIMANNNFLFTKSIIYVSD